MRKITEEDLGLSKTIDEEYKKNMVEKIVLNQTLSNNGVSVSVKESSEEVSSSQICKGCSSSSEIIGKGCECDAGVKSSEVKRVEDDSLVSVSQYNVSATPKQEDRQVAVAGVSVALVTMSEKIVDLPEIQILLNLLRTKLKQENIEMSQQNLMQILKITMELIEKSPLKGLSQKEVAIQILNRLFQESKLDNESIDVICSFLDTNLVGDTIDLIVAATKGEFDINKATKVATGCFTRMFGCFKMCCKKMKCERSCNKKSKNNNKNTIINLQDIQQKINEDIEKDVQKQIDNIIENKEAIEDLQKEEKKQDEEIEKEEQKNENIKLQLPNEMLV